MVIVMERDKKPTIRIPTAVTPEDHQELAVARESADRKFRRFDRMIEDFRKMDSQLYIATSRKK